MSVHFQVALATQMQIHDRMFGEERQHMVEKGDARFDQRLPVSVNVQLDEYAGLVGDALHLSVPLFHGCPLNRPLGRKQTENTRMRMKWAADSRKAWGQLVPSSFPSRFFRSGDGPSPPPLVRILESAVV